MPFFNKVEYQHFEIPKVMCVFIFDTNLSAYRNSILLSVKSLSMGTSYTLTRFWENCANVCNEDSNVCIPITSSNIVFKCSNSLKKLPY